MKYTHLIGVCHIFFSRHIFVRRNPVFVFRGISFATSGLVSALILSFFTVKAGMCADDFAIHPVLGTAEDAHFSGSLTDAQAQKLWTNSDDLNFFRHKKAEHDAANVLCDSLLSGRVYSIFKGFDNTCLNFCFGFNEIPLDLEFKNGKCIRARISTLSEFPKNSAVLGVENAGRIIHPVLDVAEDQPYTLTALSDWQMRKFGEEFAHRSHHDEEAALFADAELQAALIFQKQLLGLSKSQVLQKAGEPTVKTFAGKIWGDTSDGAESWIYRLGYSVIPVRLMFKNDMCCSSSFVSKNRCYKFFQLMIWLYGQGDKTAVPADIREFFHPEQAPVGLNKAKLIELYGPPNSVRKNNSESDTWFYNCGHRATGELLFAGDICTKSRLNYMMGYKRRPDFD